MRIDCALLSDAATVREGLLHILGGGVTRVGRPEYPAPVGLTLALRILVHPTETNRPHVLEISLQGEDGQRITALSIEFAMDQPVALAPGEQHSLAIPIPIPDAVQLPIAGRYSFELLIDGIHQATIPFTAHTLDAPPTGDSE